MANRPSTFMSNPFKASQPASSEATIKSSVLQSLNRFLKGSTSTAPAITQPEVTEELSKAYRLCTQADALRHYSKLSEAQALYTEAIELHPQYHLAHFGFALTLRDQGRLEEALAYLEQLAKQQPFEATTWAEAGKLATELADGEKAVRYWERSLKLSAQQTDIRFALALELEQQDRSMEAVPHYVTLVEEAPTFIPAMNNLASVYMRLGLYEKAEHWFRELMVQKPDFHRAKLGLAITLDYKQESVEAVRYYREFYALKPNSPHAPFIRERLAELDGRPAAKLVRIK